MLRLTLHPRPMLFIPIFKDFDSPAERELIKVENKINLGAVLYDEEVQPAYPALQGIDATFEEIIHNIFPGFSKSFGGAYKKFDIPRNGGKSKLTSALDQARGGRFTSVPNRYPPGSVFTYDDRTCDYVCQAVEVSSSSWPRPGARGLTRGDAQKSTTSGRC